MNKWKRDPKYAAFVKANHAFVWLPGLDDFMEKIYELRSAYKRSITHVKQLGTPEASKDASLLTENWMIWLNPFRVPFWGFQKTHVRPKIPNHQ